MSMFNFRYLNFIFSHKLFIVSPNMSHSPASFNRSSSTSSSSVSNITKNTALKSTETQQVSSSFQPISGDQIMPLSELLSFSNQEYLETVILIVKSFMNKSNKTDNSPLKSSIHDPIKYNSSTNMYGTSERNFRRNFYKTITDRLEQKLDNINKLHSNSKKDIDSAHENKVENAFVFGDDASEIQEFIEDISIFIPALVGEISLLIEDILNKLNLQDVVKHIGEDDDEHAIEVITDMIDEQLKEMVQHMSNKTYIYVSQCILGETPKTISFYKKPFVFLDTLHEEIKKYSVTKLTKMTMEELKVLKMI